MESPKKFGIGPGHASCAKQQRSRGFTGHRYKKFEKPAGRFAHVHVDLVGPLPASKGKTHLLTIIDRFTRWPEAIPLERTDAATVGRAFELNWVARFGVPLEITSDRGTQFTVGIWRALAESLGCKIHHTTAYHPQANRLVERFHRSLKVALRARLTTESWVDDLPWVLLGLRTMPKEDLGTTVAEMVYGEPLAVPGTFVATSQNAEAAEHLQRMREMAGRLVPAPDAWHGTRPASGSGRLEDAEYVFVRRTRRTDHNKRRTQDRTGCWSGGRGTKCGERQESISVDRLKAAKAEPDRDIEPAKPPKRGRPPKPRNEKTVANKMKKDRTRRARRTSSSNQRTRRSRGEDGQ